MDYRVHIGFGFHVNCYHSYRGDTCDSFGFGGDIRTIRYILDTLDYFNQKGIPVKGTWDFENAYSLEEILPKYAPDIMERVRERQNTHGDENIIMGYNNGALSAMTEDEFNASILWAISNDNHSGLEDIFGKCEKIVRPQEVMFSPSQAALYQKLGIKAVCLYYSTIPFDAFRTVIAPLEDEQAFNPLLYRYKEGEITIIPTYSPADLMDAGSLKHLVNDLHVKQQQGSINRDVFLFINIDADSFLWEPFPIPKVCRRIPNFNGLKGIVEEIEDLPFIVFDTPGGYLQNHTSCGEIFFGEDVADGNYSGYASWAEKPFNRLIWTRLERARMYSNLYKQDRESPSFEERIKLLSTTHFGLASPVLNISREQKALELSNLMVEKEEKALAEKWALKNHKIKNNEIWVKNQNKSSLLNMQLTLEKGFCFDLTSLQMKGKGLQHFVILKTSQWEDGSVKNIYVIARFQKVKKKYKINFLIKKRDEKELEDRKALKDCENTLLMLSDQSGFPNIYTESGMTVGTWDSWIHYLDHIYQFDKPISRGLLCTGDGQGIVLKGDIHLPEELQKGKYQFTIMTLPEEKGFFVVSQIQYPYTEEKTEIISQAYNLGRFCDMRWKEVAPMEISSIFHEDVKVEKRNFMGDISSFEIKDFWKSNAKNTSIKSLNHQLTGGVLSISDENTGFRIAHARQVLGSMAHCPIRFQQDLNNYKISCNPFGTYAGEQRKYPSRGNGCMMDIYKMVMPQAKSLAPAYNGSYELSAQWISLKDNRKTEKQNEYEAFADGCIIYASSGAIKRFAEDNCKLYDARTASSNKQKKQRLLPSDISILDAVKMCWNYLTNIKFT